MIFYGHTKEDLSLKQVLPKDSWQLLYDHLLAVANVAEKYADKFGASKLGFVLGLAHDLGKYSDEFQKRLEGDKQKVDHATGGAHEVIKKYPLMFGNLLAFAIAGHHGGLPDGNSGEPGNLPDRLNKNDLPDYQAFRNEVILPEITAADISRFPKMDNDMEAFTMQFFIRMLFSCLVDADFLDTEKFMTPERAEHRKSSPSMESLVQRLQHKLKDLKDLSRVYPTTLNNIRAEILSRCLKMADYQPGIFSLTVPTGGGKTYSSLAFGIKHAVHYSKERIIYVIPYTSIIEQNAQVFRDVLGESAVLEHHSNFEYPESDFEDWDPSEKAHRLASENWDRPLIVTTAVQFFESLFSNKGSKCRKLHNMAKSVIILDEAQMMPREFLKPCIMALAELVKNYQVSVVLCTATQPAINDYFPKGMRPVEIMEEPQKLQSLLKRVEVNIRGEMSDDELSHEMTSCSQVLTVVNTRKHARMLFDTLSKCSTYDNYHLSARMCPQHRKNVIDDMKKALKGGKNCRVVSTQLIEAGVDIDFPVVYRAIAGVDSIVQAAGRCNREGKLPWYGFVNVFEPEEHGIPKAFESAVGQTRSVIRRLEDLGGELLSLEAIEDYFKGYYALDEQALDEKMILKQIRNGFDMSNLKSRKLWLSYQFRKIADDFRLIDNMTTPIIVPFDEKASELMCMAEKAKYPAFYTRAFQPYIVQIYNYEKEAMLKERLIRLVGNCFYFLDNPEFYDVQYGLKDAKEVKQPDERVYIF